LRVSRWKGKEVWFKILRIKTIEGIMEADLSVRFTFPESGSYNMHVARVGTKASNK